MVPNNFGSKKCVDVNVWHQFDATTVDVNLMLTVDITKNYLYLFVPIVDGQLMSTVDSILMSIQKCLPTGDAGGELDAQCLVLIFSVCLSFRALLEVKHALNILISIEL